MNIFEEVCKIKRKGEAGILVTVVEKVGDGPAEVGKKLLVERNGRVTGTVGGGDLELWAIQKAKELLGEQKSLMQNYDYTNQESTEDTTSLNIICGGMVTLYYEYIAAMPTVYIFGIGYVGRHLASLLPGLEYNVVLIDDGDALEMGLREEHKVYCGDYSEIIQELNFAEDSYLVVCAYSHEIEYQILKALYVKGCMAKYVGLLACKNKAEQIFAKLEEELGFQPDLSKLYAPIGLDIGGKAPEEIAVSIAAELQAIRYGRLGNKHMTLQWT